MQPPVKREDFGHFYSLPTRWADLDMLGHVNNAKFFAFDESARLDYFGKMFENDPKFWKDYGLILASIACDFLSQLHHPATLDVGMRITRLGKSSMQTQGGIFHREKLVAVTRGTVVWFNYLEQKPLAIPEAVRAQIRAREIIKPEEPT